MKLISFIKYFLLLSVIAIFSIAAAKADTVTSQSSPQPPAQSVHPESTHLNKKSLHSTHVEKKSVHHAVHNKTAHHTAKPLHHAVHAVSKHSHHTVHAKSAHTLHHEHHAAQHKSHSLHSTANSIAVPHTIAITPSQLASYEKYPTEVKTLILESMQLAKQNLNYHFGSDNPKNRGMDCSGTVSYILKKMHIYDVPRESDDIYEWVLHKGEFHWVSNHDFSSADFSKIKPGDLLFWENTFRTHRSVPITHVMIYLGKNKFQEPLMFGANGSRHGHEKIWGVSVFSMLPSIANAHFVGYGCIPNVSCG